MILKTHGSVQLGAGRLHLEADYQPADAGPGSLSLRLIDQERLGAVERRLRLDPWIADEYRLIEFEAGGCFVLSGAQAVVAVAIADLGWRSSVGLEYEEGETLDAPWCAEVEERRLLVVATERRVWCLEAGGTVRWIWGCSSRERDGWISGRPVVAGDGVLVPVRALGKDQVVKVRLDDGLPEST